ncbi:MAG: trypsin-like peptidase domain-containing protein [Acidimicrobiia bacterium]|nr:trypsin-like peptidase domain-containing protein [Acidimicrobiia bacterium]
MSATGTWNPDDTTDLRPPTAPPNGVPAGVGAATARGPVPVPVPGTAFGSAPTAPPVGAPRLPGAGMAPPPDPTQPLPRHPPRLTRPDTTATAGWWPAAPAQPPTPAGPEVAATPAPAVRPASGWGWRVLAAFLAGGLLTGGGFTAATYSRDANAAPASTSTVVAPVGASSSAGQTGTTVQGGSAPSLAPPASIDPNQEPAAYVSQALGPSVVQIVTEFGLGSGVIYDQNLVLTNNHVIEGANQIQVVLADGRHLDGTLVGADVNSDVAVVRVPDGQNLTPASLALGEKAQVGQLAVAIGSPFELQQTVTAGIISAVDRPVMTGRNEPYYTAMIQTDAPINPGNSGGALADRRGRVIGINTAIETGGGSNTNAGIGFAIPIDTAHRIAQKLVAGEPIESGLLGVEGRVPADGSAGVEVTQVTPGSAAESAGIRTGDLILSLDGAPVTSFEVLAGLVLAHPPGDVVQLEIVRGGQPQTVTATLGQRP